MKIRAILSFNQPRQIWELAFSDPTVRVYYPPIEEEVNSIWWPFYECLPVWIRRLGPREDRRLVLRIPTRLLAREGLLVVPKEINR